MRPITERRRSLWFFPGIEVSDCFGAFDVDWPSPSVSDRLLDRVELVDSDPDNLTVARDPVFKGPDPSLVLWKDEDGVTS